jgi:hypothetical protein
MPQLKNTDISKIQLNLTDKKETCVDILTILERCILDGHDCNANFNKYKRLCKETDDKKSE